MNPLEATDIETVLSGRTDWVGPDVMETLARHPLDAIDTEFPHYISSIESPDETPRPAEQHPIFYGCFDWHSAVHSHWCLIRQLRLFEDHPAESEIVQSIESRFTPENVSQEVAYFDDHEAFEKPYGWAWLLQLASELHLWDDERADEWASILQPLETRIRELVTAEFLPQNRPFRVATHHNSAFALHCLFDYARTTDEQELGSAVIDTARRFYMDDRNYPVEYEPLGWDFISPALTEADLMRRVLDPAEFRTWTSAFFPDVTTAPYDSLLRPAHVNTSSEDGVALHLVGLNVSKAWSLAGLVSALDDHPFVDTFENSARSHAERGLAQAFTEDYAGTHWLTSYVLYLLTRNDGGIAPG
jgi:hypothetical protein